jgi:hypothetical protein
MFEYLLTNNFRFDKIKTEQTFDNRRACYGYSGKYVDSKETGDPFGCCKI